MTFEIEVAPLQLRSIEPLDLFNVLRSLKIPTVVRGDIWEALEAIQEAKLEHLLVRTEKTHNALANYFCSCGMIGKATMAPHLADPRGVKIIARATFNHAQHQTRAYIKKIGAR